jgi:hypothetical protein
MADLDDLAARGRRARAERDAADTRAAGDRARAEERSRRLVADAATVPLGFAIAGRSEAYALLMMVAVPSLLLTLEDPALLVWPIGLHAGILGLLLVVKLASLGGARREDAWAARFPFRLEGWSATLGDLSGRTFGRYTSGPSLKLTIAIELSAVAGPELADILTGFDPKAEAKVSGARLELRRASFPGAETNRPLLLYVHRLAKEVLLPLHEKQPIAQVSVELAT